MKEEFLKELQELLTKYNADFWISLDGDTHGVSAELVVDVNNKEVLRRSDGTLSKYDIKNDKD